MSIKIKNKNKEGPERELSRKVGLFDKIPDRCLTCNTNFDKKDKEMVMTWYVVVREKEGKVNLYCPECWDKAERIIEEFGNGTSDTV
tara:strand:+ start:1554 stop:1814 length:261 start_codon:yes stop_codon:yes gene_type:complete